MRSKSIQRSTAFLLLLLPLIVAGCQTTGGASSAPPLQQASANAPSDDWREKARLRYLGLHPTNQLFIAVALQTTDPNPRTIVLNGAYDDLFFQHLSKEGWAVAHKSARAPLAAEWSIPPNAKPLLAQLVKDAQSQLKALKADGVWSREVLQSLRGLSAADQSILNQLLPKRTGLAANRRVLTTKGRGLEPLMRRLSLVGWAFERELPPQLRAPSAPRSLHVWSLTEQGALHLPSLINLALNSRET